MDKFSDSKELGRVTVGVPGVVSAEVPVRRSGLTWITRLFARRTVGDTLIVASARARVHVPADDEGTIEFYVTLANMGGAPVEVEAIMPSRVAASGNELAILAPVSRPPQKQVGPGRTGELGVRFPIGAQAIRAMLRCVQRADNRFSSPRVELLVSGTITGKLGQQIFQLPFAVAAYSPELNIQCPSIVDA